MGMTVNNLGTLSLLNILNRTATAQENVLQRMATGSRINRGADDPAGLIALSGLNAEITAVDAGIASNQRTDAILGVADSALAQISTLLEDVQRVANNTANDSALTADEKAANQAQIDDALASIDRIIASTQFNGRKLLDGSLGIQTTVGDAGAITDVKAYSRRSGATDTTLTVKVETAASNAALRPIMTTSTDVATSFSVQGKLGTAVIAVAAGENLSSIEWKINQAKNQTGVSAILSSTSLNVWSTTKGSGSFVRTQLIAGSGVTSGADYGADAGVVVNGQAAAVDGTRVSYAGGGVSVAFEIGTLGVNSSTTLTIKGSGGATFQLGTTSDSRATIGIDGCFTSQLGDSAGGFLASLKSGEANSLLTNPSQAAQVARNAAKQVATLQGRIGGFQKFQVGAALTSLNETKIGLEKAKSVINDVDYATESAELNRQNILLQSAMSLLGLANQQSSQVLALLR